LKNRISCRHLAMEPRGEPSSCLFFGIGGQDAEFIHKVLFGGRWMGAPSARDAASCHTSAVVG
jgi:hypothetical protein